MNTNRSKLLEDIAELDSNYNSDMLNWLLEFYGKRSYPPPSKEVVLDELFTIADEVSNENR